MNLQLLPAPRVRRPHPVVRWFSLARLSARLLFLEFDEAMLIDQRARIDSELPVTRERIADCRRRFRDLVDSL